MLRHRTFPLLVAPFIAFAFAGGALGAAAPAAFAESPWWHLTSGARPNYIQAGLARSEVQQLTVNVSSGQIRVERPERESGEQGSTGETALVSFDATRQELETQLEGLYGAGNIGVAGGPLATGTGDLTEGSTELTGVAMTTGAFAVGQEITGAGIQPGAKIEKVEGAALTLSKAATETVTGDAFAVLAPYTIAFKSALADQVVAPITIVSEGENENHETRKATVTEIARGRPDGEIYVTAENLGDQSLSGSPVPVHLSDVLPHGLRAVGIAGSQPYHEGQVFTLRGSTPCSLEDSGARATCTFSGALAPYDELEMLIPVVVEGPVSGENEASVSGGEGFRCLPVAAGTGSYQDSGCRLEEAPLSFERSPAQPVPGAQLKAPVTISSASVPFGVNRYELVNEDEGGAPVTQAGAHPFQQTTTIVLNQAADIAPLHNLRREPGVDPAAPTKDLHLRWPAGLIGNPSAFPQCPDTQFFAISEAGVGDFCKADTAVGVALVTVYEPFVIGGVFQVPVPLFNLQPHVGEPARFGFIVQVSKTPVVIDTSVRTGGDYGVTVEANNITESSVVLASEVTVWGVPGDPRHDRQRGWSCLLESRGYTPRSVSQGGLGPCASAADPHPPAFLSMPTSCTGPLSSSVEGDSWTNEGVLSTLAETSLPALDGCNRLPFSPSIRVTPDVQEASRPSGLNVDVHVPQEETLNAEGLAEAAPRDITVALPEGVAVNPSSGDGLLACSQALAGFTGFAELVPPGRTATFTETLPSPLLQGVNVCPDASKIGEVTIKTPILPNPIKGFVYLASQNQNPFGGLLAMYVIAEDPVSGVLIKLAGSVHLSESGQIVTTFEDSPQAPFEDAEFHFFGGERAPLATPARCGTYTTSATFTSWAASPPVTATSAFNITSGPGGAPCPGSALPFSPSLAAGTSNINAGGFTPLTTTISRGEGQQDLQSVQLHMPPGLSGVLSGVKLCPEQQANEGTCGPESLIGETTVSAGVGADPVSVKGGRVYLTEHYAGAPFGLSIVNPVKAGPFDLEHDTFNPAQQPACDCVVVRAKIEVDPHTAALTVTTDPSGSHSIPHLIDGIPVQIQKVNVLVNRPGFTFNPTNCNPMSLTGAIVGDEGASSPVSVPFQATNCASLKFTPKFAVSTSGKNSKANGASLTVKLSEPNEPQGFQASIARVKVELPKQLPSRLTTLQKACTAAQFDANPAGCPAASIIGHAIVRTPLLPVPLEGPAYFVSNGGEAFPNLIMVLQGYGVRIDLVGDTFISKAGVTSSTFETVPDVPFNTFELTLPTGKFSALTALGNVCSEKLTMPTEFVAQNGALLKQNTKVGVTGCPRKKALTRAQKLVIALKACHKQRNHAKRNTCEKKARRKYGAINRKKSHKTRH